MRAIGAAALVLLATACAEPPAKPELQLAACEVGEQRLDARCGSWQVLEDRAQPQGPRISLRVAVLEALTTERAVDPLFVLVGGPGQAASSSGVPLAQALSALRRTRDVVLVDQRGTGASNPLNCPARDAGLSLELRSDDTLDSEWVQSCRKASKADLAKYTTPHALADLDEVRTALGYERINLWGGSYGSRVALQYAVVYPEHTRSVILDGAAPTDVKLPLYAGRDAQRALERLYADCAAEPACARTFPQGLAQFESLLSELEREPRTVNVPHPSTGARTEVRVTKAGVAAAVRGLLYSTELSRLVPLLVARAKAGDFAPLVTSAATLGDGIAQAGLSLGMFLSVMCSEDVPRISASELSQVPHGFFGTEYVQALQRACSAWPRGEITPRYFEPPVFDAPTLVLSGELDPVLPPSWGELVTSALPNARHVVVPAAAHGVTQVACVPELIARFVGELRLDALDTSCVQLGQRAAFFTTPTGPSQEGLP